MKGMKDETGEMERKETSAAECSYCIIHFIPPAPLRPEGHCVTENKHTQAGDLCFLICYAPSTQKRGLKKMSKPKKMLNLL